MVITGCGNATLQVDLPVYGEAPAGVWLVDDQGRTVGSLSLAAALPDGGLYRGVLDSNAALPPVPTTSATRVFSIVARYADDTLLTALFGAYRRTCPGVTGAVYDADAFTLLPGALVTLLYHDPAAGEQIWNGAPVRPEQSAGRGSGGDVRLSTAGGHLSGAGVATRAMRI